MRNGRLHCHGAGRRWWYLALLTLCTDSAFAQGASASGAAPANACELPPAKAASIQGTVEVRRKGPTQWSPIRLGDTFCPGDQIRVGERSRADVALLNQTVMRLNANTTITVETPKERRTGVVELLR